MPTSLDSIRSAYDIASEAYSRKFIDELDRKPFDCRLLYEFSRLIDAGEPVLDIGCGPGHTTAHLASLGLMATGIDLSPTMIAHAKHSFPEANFEAGDFFELSRKSFSIGGILAFYCIVHLTSDQLIPAFSEMHRVLQCGGVLLLAFHVGEEVVHVENFLDTAAVLDFTFFSPSQIHSALTTAGFSAMDIRVREPYESEHPSQRCYIFAHKRDEIA
jgi:SAM-dependent methyltransferase